MSSEIPRSGREASVEHQLVLGSRPLRHASSIISETVPAAVDVTQLWLAEQRRGRLAPSAQPPVPIFLQAPQKMRREPVSALAHAFGLIFDYKFAMDSPRREMDSKAVDLAYRSRSAGIISPAQNKRLRCWRVLFRLQIFRS